MKDKHPANSLTNRFPFADTPTFEQAEVPSYMLQLEIDTLPANRAFYIDADAEPTWSSMPSILVDKSTSKMHLNGTAEVDDAQGRPVTPLGRVGIMRVETIDESGKIISFFVADLRFIENHELSVVNDIDDAPDDSEDFNSWEEYRKELREVVAFIAPIPGTEASKKGIIPAAYLGPEKYHGALDDIRLQGDKIITKSLKRQNRTKKLAKVAVDEKPVTDESPIRNEAEKPSTMIYFSHK